MINIRYTSNAAAWWKYYLAHPALLDSERRGIWHGVACAELGWITGGLVRGEEFACLLDGYTLSRQSCVQKRSVRRRSAYDVVISAPKSVSIAALCWDDEEGRAEIRSAFNGATMNLARVCEGLVKRQSSSWSRILTGNMASAIFTHQASRYGDPHLHSHIVIGNLTRYRGTWCAIALDTIYKAHMSLDRLFMADLTGRLKKAGLGAKVVEGKCELSVGRNICERLSKGWSKLEAASDRVGSTGRRRSALKEILNDRLRPRKQRPLNDFGSVIVPPEQRRLKRLWQSGAPLHAVLSGRQLERELRVALREVGAPSERNRVEAASRVALNNLGVPIEVVVGAALRPGLLHGFDSDSGFSDAMRERIRRMEEQDKIVPSEGQSQGAVQGMRAF